MKTLIRILAITFAFFALEVAVCSGQSWSTFIDSSRAIDFTSAGFTIPSYTVNCATQPTLLTGSSNAATNASRIQTALASCDATHNVVNIPAGTWYVAGFNFGAQGKQVLRGAGPNSTTLNMTTNANCGGLGGSICMQANPITYGGSSDVLPPGGPFQCLWTGGFAKGSTSITVNSCPIGAPAVGTTIILDQANDTSDTGGIYICDNRTAGCSLEAGPGDNEGRTISGVTHSVLQMSVVTSVSGSGTGPFTIGISAPGVLWNNIRSGKSAGIWWPGIVKNDGIENLTVDYTSYSGGVTDIAAITIMGCYQCWMKNIRSINATRDHVMVYESANDVIRDSYFYQAQNHASQSYGMEIDTSSNLLIENNIFQQQSTPIVFQNGQGSVVDYNYSIDNVYTASPTYMTGTYYDHNAGNSMNLWEGNNFSALYGDEIHGASTNGTWFRNMLIGWQSGKSNSTIPVILRSWNRAFNLVGNVIGQPGYHTQYQTIATSQSGGTGGGALNTSIYSIGWANDNFCGTGGSASPFCDPLAVSTLMRWGNYDVVTGSSQFTASEAAPGAVPYVNANFTTTYFGSLTHNLPSSLYYSSTPSWWPGTTPFPPIGPDVSTGNVGLCSGTYAGSQATTSAQCSGGTKSAAWSSHVNAIPAQTCFLSLGGPPDGSGASALAFDASTCYAPSSSFTWTKTIVGSGTVTGTNNTSGSYAAGTTIGPLTATPSTGYVFTGWSSVSGSAACSGATNPCPAFTLSSNSAATATFTIQSFTLSTATTGTGSGTVSCTPPAGAVTYNTAVSCIPSPAAGSTVTNMTGCGGVWSSSPYTFNMPASNCTATANFTLSSKSLTVTTSGTGSGTVTGPNCSTGSYPYGTNIGPCAGNATSGVFGGWTGTGDASGCVGTSTCGFTLTQTTTLDAAFTTTKVPDPTFTPGAGTYGSTQSVVISDSHGTPSTVVSMTETSNANSSTGAAPHRNTYTNCATGYSGGQLQPAGQPVGNRYCTTADKTAAEAAGGPVQSVVTSTITGTGTTALDNGNGAGGSDSPTSVTATYGGTTSTACAVGTSVASAYVTGLTLPGESASSGAVFQVVTPSSGFNTSLLSVTKYNINGDAGNYLVTEDCAPVGVASASGMHYEWDTNYNNSGGTYFGFGMDYDFPNQKLRVAPQGSSWINVELCPLAGGACVTTYAWNPATQSLYSETYKHWDTGCSYSSSTSCAHYDVACLQLWASGSPVNSLTCYQMKNASTHGTLDFIPINKTSWTHPQYGIQHQWDINSGSKTITSSPWSHTIAYTPGTNIYYTSDGSTPTTASTLYNAPISVATSQTLKALATAPGLVNSNVVSAAYVIGSVTLGITAVNGSVSGTNCSAGSYTVGTVAGACTATPNSGFTFAGWSGTGACSAASGTGTTSCTLSSNGTLTATFTPSGTVGIKISGAKISGNTKWQ